MKEFGRGIGCVGLALLAGALLAGCGKKGAPQVILPLEILTTELGDAVRTRDYNNAVAVQGGVPPYDWRVSAGALPDGLVLGFNTGLIVGQPTAIGTFSFTVRVTDGSQPVQQATKDYTIDVAEPLVITTDALPDATVGLPYRVQFNKTGGTDPVTWSEGIAALPTGLTLDPDTGLITGTPVTAGQPAVSLRATDSATPPQQAVRSMGLTIHPGTSGPVTRASVGDSGAEADGASTNPRLGTDGLRVVFESAATNLIAADTNSASDIFLFDLLTGAVSRLSLTATGGEPNGASRRPAVNGALTALAFESDAVTLVPTDTNGVTDIFIRLITAATTGLVSLRSDGTQASAASAKPALSDDGQFVAFTYDATDLDPTDTNGVRDIYVRDRSAGTTTRISVGPGGAEVPEPSDNPSVASSTPVAIAFESAATGLTAPATSGTQQIFVRESGVNIAVSTVLHLGNTTADIVGTDHIGSNSLALTVDEHIGRRVHIFKGAGAGQERLVSSNTATTLFVDPPWDTLPDATSEFRVVSEADGASSNAAISANGKVVAFESLATNLIGTYDTNGVRDIYIHDRDTGRVARVSVGLALGNQLADIFSANTIGLSTLTMTPNEHVGRLVEITKGLGVGQIRRVIANDATTLTVDADWTTLPDGTSEFRVITEATGPSFTPSISEDGRYVAFASDAANLVPGDTNGLTDIFVHDRQTGITRLVSRNRDGTQANGPSRLPALSRNGQYCAFVSDATNLVPNDTNGLPDVFLAFAAGDNLPVITTHTLPDATVGAPYSVTLALMGGVAPFTWSLDGTSTLPPDLVLDAATGEISGTPSQAGTFTFTILVTDADGNTDTQFLSLTISEPPP